MTQCKSAFLTITMEVASKPDDPLDSPGSSKRLMIDTADGLVDGALAKMPAYLNGLPQGSLPSIEDLRRAFRRDYKLSGTHLKVDLRVEPSALPSAWLEGLDAVPESVDPPWIIVWTTRVLGWMFGLSRDDRDKAMREAHSSVMADSRDKLRGELCQSMMQLACASVEAELLNHRQTLMVEGPLRSITIQRGV